MNNKQFEKAMDISRAVIRTFPKESLEVRLNKVTENYIKAHLSDNIKEMALSYTMLIDTMEILNAKHEDYQAPGLAKIIYKEYLED